MRTAYEIDFIRTSIKGVACPSGTIALGTSRWYKKLRTEGVGGLRLVLPIEWQVAPKPGTWGIVTDGTSGMEIWSASRSSRASKGEDPTPWKYEYASSRALRWTLEQPCSTEQIQSRFEPLLVELWERTRDRTDEISEIIDRLLVLERKLGLQVPSADDVLPESLETSHRTLGASSLRAVVLCSLPGLDREEDDEILKLYGQLWDAAMRGLEIACSVFPTEVGKDSVAA